jgi:hypothetical protein
MDIYTDYANWKFENHDFIYQLVRSKSKTISRFTSVIIVVDYLYEKYVKTNKLTADEEVMFNVGFDYMHDNFFTIKTLLDYTFDKDYFALEKCAKTINLLLYVNEFQGELLNSLENPANELEQLDEFEHKLTEYLDKKENCPDEFFPYLDDLVNPIFERNSIEFTPIEAIFYEIALEYGIAKNNDSQAFLNILEQVTNK